MSPPDPLSENEFQRLFASEAEGRLEALVDQLLELERGGPTPDLVASLFREAHTLKGGAAVVGMTHVASVAHAMEDLLEEVRGGRRAVDPGLIDAVLGGVDAIRGFIPAAIKGEDHAAPAAAAEQRLRAVLSGAAPGPIATASANAPQSPATPPASASPSGPGATLGAAPTDDDGQATATTTEASPPASEKTSAPAAAASAQSRVGELPVRSDPAPSAAPGGGASGDVVQIPVARIDDLVRLIGEASASTLRLGSALLDKLGRDPASISEYRDLARSLNQLQELALRARMVPVMSVAQRLRRAVRDVARETGKDVRFETRGEDAEIDRGVLERLADPLLHLIRNAVDHGIEPAEERIAAGKPAEGTVRLHAMQLGSEVVIAVTDDGRGIDVGRVRSAAGRSDAAAAGMDDESALYLIFRSGLSTAEKVTGISGRGVGLDAVRANLNSVRGRIEVRSELGQGTEFRIAVPITMTTLRCLVVTAAGQRYAIPLHSIRTVLPPQPTAQVGGKPMTMVDGRPVAVGSLAAALGTGNGCDGPAVVISGLTRTHALTVDTLIDQRDVVVKGLGSMVPRLPAIAGAGVQPDGSILLVLEAAGIIDRARRESRRYEQGAGDAPVIDSADDLGVVPTVRQSASILVVDDALTVRELQRSIFEHAGYRVRTAANGEEALARMSEERPDLVLTDVEMPRMDGFVLTEQIRSRPALASVPVVILTSRGSDEDRRRGLEVGADGYIIKAGFDQAALLSAVERLLGPAT